MRLSAVSNPTMASVTARLGTLVLAATIVAAAGDRLQSQERALTIVSASPRGDVSRLADAGEIRIVFSEPMVAIGGEVTRPPEWLSLAPTIRAAYYWSGTRTLIVTADPDTPIPFATRFTATIGAAARSASGRAIASPFSFSFTTPTVRLLGASWYRKTGRFDSPAVIALRFNQPVRAADVIAHADVRDTPHTWTRPVLTDAARTRLSSENAAGLARFDRKVERVAAVAASAERVAVTAAASWDEKRFPPAPELVVIETTGVPSTDAWLTVALDARMPSPGGPETTAAQSTVVRLEPTFFVNDNRCSGGCAPGFSSVGFRRGVALDAARQAVSVTWSAGSPEPGSPDRAVARIEPTPIGYESPAGIQSFQLPQLGYPVQPPASQWVYRVDPSLTAVDGQVLDYPWLEVVQNLHAMPYADWEGTVWEASGGTAPLIITRNITNISSWAAPMRAADVLPRLLRLRQQSAPLAPDVPASQSALMTRADDVEAHGIDMAHALSPSGLGLAWAAFVPNNNVPNSASPPSNYNRLRPALMQVTNLGLTVKDSPRSTLVFVTRLDTAQPVAGARVTIRTEKNPELWTGTTGADGTALAPALTLRDPRNTWQLSYVVTAEKDGDTAWVGSDWHDGNLMNSVLYALDPSPETLRGALFTDRGLYVKGEDVRVKAVFRNDTPGGMQMFGEGLAIDAIVRDPRGAEIDRQHLRLNRWSAVDWVVHLPAEPTLGGYTIEASVPSSTPIDRRRSVFGTFAVAAFRRPDFRVDAKVSAPVPLLGESLHASAEARYLFGAPVGRQPVRWYITKSMVTEVPDAIHQRFPDERYAFGYTPDPSASPRLFEQLRQNKEALDAKGTIAVDVPTTAGEDYPSNFQFEAEVPNAAGQPIANRADITLHPASFYVGLARPPFFVDARTGLSTTIVAADLDGGARAGVRVKVTLWREQWSSEPDARGYAGVRWVRKELPAGEWAMTTAGAPVPLAAPIRDGGAYVLRATATDERGRPTRTDVHFYALGGGAASWRTDGNRITLVPERETWEPGQTARILVQSPWAAATALVTKEREGIRTHTRVDITSTQDVVEMPITEADFPNVYVSVVLVKGRTTADAQPDNADPGRPGFRVGTTELTVNSRSHNLTVTVKADREEYAPRQPVSVSVGVTDPAGKPQAGEVTLWAVDYGVLSLSDYKVPDVARQIYVRKALQVQTQDNRLRLIARLPAVNDREPIGAGGGGRGGGAGLAAVPAPPPLAAMAESIIRTDSPTVSQTVDADFIQTLSRVDRTEAIGRQAATVRDDFRSLVFWLGSVTSDANGRATTTVTLPDSLTTYRIMAVAGDLSSRFGAGDAEITATKPLTLLPEFPRFLSTGDHASLSAIVTNNTKAAGDVTVTMRSLDIARLSTASVTSRVVHLAAGESQSVTFDAVAAADGPARIRIAAALGAETDAFEVPIPITAPLRIETVAAYGDTIASATEKLRLPAGARPDKGGLSVSLASTALVGLGESARYLDEYPYECAEQKASRALALLLSADLGGAFRMSSLKPDELRASGLALLKELASYQCPSGGFGLFAGSCDGNQSLYLTAYVLDVMQQAGALKAPTDRFAIDRALDFLMSQLRQPPPEAQWWPAWAASQSYAVRMLAVLGRNPRQDIDRLVGFADRMPVFALSYLADALGAIGDRGPRYQDVIRRITNALRADADRAHVEEVDDAALLWLWNTNVRATAVVLDGFARREDAGAPMAELVRWLLAARENGRWGTTHENATALSALVGFYKTAEAAVPDMTARVSLGGRTIGQSTFAGRSTATQELRVAMPDLVKQLSGEAARDLLVSRTGTGRLYYTARLQYGVLTPAAAVDRGIHIDRRYQSYTPEALGPASTTFAAGDLVRVTLTISVPHEGRFLAITDPLPAGFEPVDGSLKTTATDLAAVSTTQSSDTDRFAWWRRGGFDFVQKHDDRVVAFATRLSAGRHEFTYLIRATTSGTFGAAGAFGEAMYAPEITGRSAAATITIRPPR